MLSKIGLYLKNNLYWSISILVMLIIARGFQYIFPIYYLALLILMILVLSKIELPYILDSDRIFNNLIILYLGWCLLSSFWSSHQFYSFLRAIYQILLAAGMYRCAKIIFYKKIDIHDTFILSAVIFVLASFYSLITGFPFNSWTGGNGKGFMGLAVHQNSLGAILIILSPSMIMKLILSKNIRCYFFKNHLIPFIALILLNLALIMLLVITFSRGALISYLAFMILFGLFILPLKKNIIISGGLIALLLIFLQIGAANRLLVYITYKGDTFITDSRIELMQISYEAAKKSWLTGNGYGISDDRFKEKIAGRYSGNIYIREKVNSTLAIIEEVGVMGIALFYGWLISLLSGNIKYLIKKRKIVCTPNFNYNFTTIAFLTALLSSLFLHAQFEAWMTGVGSVSFPIFLFFSFYNHIYLDDLQKE